MNFQGAISVPSPESGAKAKWQWSQKSKSKSKKTFFKVGQCKQYNISSHLKWVLVADKSMHISKVQ